MKPTPSFTWFAPVVGALTFATVVHAADFQWDPNGTTAGLGGTGTWNTTNTFWDALATGDNTGTDTTQALTFSNADKAIFGGSTGTVTLGTPTTVNALEFNSAYTLTGSTLTLAGATPTIKTTANTTISSALSGSGGFTKEGSGILTLINTGNNFTGTVNINEGTLRFLRPAATGGFSASANFVVNNGGILNFNTNNTGTWSVPLAPITLNGGTLSFNATAGVGQYATGVGQVTVNSASFITVAAGAAPTSGNASSLFLDNGLTGSGDLTIGSSTNGIGVILRGAGNTYTGKITVNGNGSTTAYTSSGLALGPSSSNMSNADFDINGTLELGGTGFAWGAGAVTGTTFQLDALGGSSTGVVVGNMGAAGSTRTLSLGNNNGSATFSGTIANGTNNTLTLTKNGTGTQTFAGTSTYTGTSTVNNGTLKFAKTTSFYNSATGLVSGTNAAKLIVNSGGTGAFNVGGTGEFNATDIATLLNASTATAGFKNGSTLGLDTTNAGGNFSYATTITDTNSGANALGLTKQGTGKLTLSGTNTYTGATTVSAGTLQVDGSLHANSTVNVLAGATLAGIGTIGGSVNVTGVLAPGASIESLTVGNTTFNDGSTLSVEVQDTSATGADLLAIHGDLSLTGTVTLDLLKLGVGGWSLGDKLTLASYTGLWNGGLFTYDGNTVTNGGLFSFDNELWTLNYDDATKGNNYASDSDGSYVTMTAVPEPAMAVLGAFGLLRLLRRRRA